MITVHQAAAATAGWPRLISHLATGIVLLGALSVAACSATTPQGTSGAADAPALLSLAEVNAEYQAATQEFPGPAGYQYPADPFSGSQPGGLFEKGYGRTQAVFFWNCAWEKQWLTLRGSDPAGAQQALDTLETVKQTDVYRNGWREMTPMIDSRLEAASLGDPSGIQDDVNANCLP